MISDAMIDEALQWCEIEVVTRNLKPLCIDCLSIALARKLVIFADLGSQHGDEPLDLEDAAEQAVDLVLRVAGMVKHQ